MRSISALLIFTAILLSESSAGDIKYIRTGSWGSGHMGMLVEPDGASIEFDCGHGSIEQPILLDKKGRFNVEGIYVREHGGPIRQDEPADAHPARYTGRVNRKMMSITVTLTDTMETVGGFILIYGQSPYVTKCL